MGDSTLAYGWMGCSTVSGAAVIAQAPNGPYAAGSTPVFTGQLLDPYGVGIPAAAFSSLTLSIVDTLSGDVINGASQVNILNTGRGTVDASGNLVISLLAADTAMSEAPGASQIQRSLVIDWTYATVGLAPSAGSGRHQVNFLLLSLAGP